MQVVIVIGEPNQADIDGRTKERFIKEADNFKKRLIEEFGFLEDDFIVLTGGLQLPISSQLEKIIFERWKNDIILCYIGHGAENGWGLSGYTDNEVLVYENLRILLELHCGNLIFLNTCCYALAAEEAVSSHFGDYLLIGAMAADKRGCIDNFLDTILNYCLNHRSFVQPKI